MRPNRLFIFILLFWTAGCSSTANRIESSNQIPVEKTGKTQISDERALKLLKIKDSVAPFFKPMGEPEEYDWLASFKEPGQTFEEYLNAAPTLPTETRRVIYIQPLGEFTATQGKVLTLVAEYMGAFYNLPVKLNPVEKLGEVPPELQRKNYANSPRQVRTTFFLDNKLPAMLPDDAAAFLCFTNEDLYPGDEWYFVFGQANLQTRVGVWSLQRLGEPEKSRKNYERFLARTLKIAIHETGHMFTMLHCTKYECLMSGTNGLHETDRRPLDVCPECAAKISWAMNYQPTERYRNLTEFWKRQGWQEEEKVSSEKAEAVEKAAK